MNRVMCGKMSVAYQNVEIGKAPSNVTYKVGLKAGQQQCGAGGDGSVYKVPNQHDSAARSVISLSMYLRPQAPDASNSCLAPLSPLNSTSLRPDGEKLSPATTSPNLYTGLSSLNAADVGESRSTPASDGNVAQTRLSLRSWSPSSSCSTDSSDEDQSSLSYFRDLYGQAPCDTDRLIQSSVLGSSDNPLPELPSSSSSIGCDEGSSCSSREGSNEESSENMEVESRGPLHFMSSLEASLPIKRGLSRFWSGKSRSFTCLADVTSIAELAKPENPYAKRRRSAFGDRHKSFPPLSRSSAAGISKRHTATSGSRSGLAMAVAMGSKLEDAPKHATSASLCPSRSMSFADLIEASSHLATLKRA